MTDGILLAETQSDRQLRKYDTIILDEAHERSLNIDFLLGYLKRLLPKRPDLKVIITSATIDAERFAAHFADRRGKPAPIIEVSGRTYPVEVRYRPLIACPTRTTRASLVRDQTEAIVEAVGELSAPAPATSSSSCPASARSATPPTPSPAPQPRGAAALRPALAAEQHRVFADHAAAAPRRAGDQRGRDLADLPGIRYVVDRASRGSRATL